MEIFILLFVLVPCLIVYLYLGQPKCPKCGCRTWLYDDSDQNSYCSYCGHRRDVQ